MKKFPMCMAALLTICCTASAGPDLADNWAERVGKVKFGIMEAIDRGLKEAGSGVLFAAELEPQGNTLIYSLDIAKGHKMCNVVIDAISGKVIEKIVEGDDQSKVVAACKKVGLKKGIQAALKKCPGTPFFAELFVRNGKPGMDVVVVTANGQVKTLMVDGTSGEASEVEAPKR